MYTRKDSYYRGGRWPAHPTPASEAASVPSAEHTPAAPEVRRAGVNSALRAYGYRWRDEAPQGSNQRDWHLYGPDGTETHVIAGLQAIIEQLLDEQEGEAR